MAIEALTYQNLQAYLAETPNSVMELWSPKKVMEELLAADPNADKSATVFLGVQKTQGVPSDDMQFLGEDRRFTQKWGNKAHNALGSFLHEPTIRQNDTGKATEADARSKAADIADELDRMLATGLFDVNMGHFICFGCVCGFQVKRRTAVLSHDDIVICGGCGRQWICQKIDGESDFQFIPDDYSFPCLSCKETCFVGAHELRDGRIVICSNCTAKAEVYTQFAVRAYMPDSSKTRAAAADTDV